jgi:Zn-dependent protease with chaperone function
MAHTMKYPARAIHSSLGSGTVLGEIQFGGEKLIFDSAKGGGELPLAGLLIRVGGHNEEQIFFSHPNHPDWSLYTSERAVLDDPQIRMRRELADQGSRAGRLRPAWRALGIVAITLSLLCLALVICFVACKDRVVHTVAKRIPVSWEVKFGDALFEQIKARGQMVEDPSLHAELNAVTDRLLKAITGVEYAFQFHIVNDTNINAFAIPGGHILVHTGLLAAADSSEELAGVLGHEIAHLTQRHGFRKIIEASGLVLLLQALVGDAAGLTAVLADGSRLLLEQKFSRDFEREADDVGWKYLLQGQINPRGMIDFFEKLKQEQELRPSLGIDFLSTHPATQERIDRLEEKWKALKRKPEFIKLPPVGLREQAGVKKDTAP